VPRYQHDWALLTLLTDPTREWNRPKEMMRLLYVADPTNPNYATGYAFALTQGGKPAQALAIVAKLSKAERDYSPRAPYLAYVYGSNGNKDEEARLEQLAGAAAFLPEERLLFVEAREADLRKPIAPPANAPRPKPVDKS
ncbi:MAG TPA: hypothetical protein VNZ67_05110, partial [bacterium]|nr:hypothetical protein [bacterium]